MNSKAYLVAIAASVLLVSSHCARPSRPLVLKRSYLGQTPPGIMSQIFAPGIVSSEHQEHSSLAISPDGREMWWSRWRLPLDMERYPQVIIFITFEKGRWSQPKVAPFSGRYRDGGPAFSADGNKLFFYSRRPLEDGKDEMPENDIWLVERTGDGWSSPKNLGPTVNSPFVEATPSLAANGNLYFTSTRVQYDDSIGNSDIFVSELIDGEYTEPRGLGAAINSPSARDSSPFIAPDESYIIFSRDSRRFDAGGNVIDGDRKLMISYKDSNGAWQEAVDMGPQFSDTRFPSVSPDGRYLFFTKFTAGGSEDFYWVDARILEKFKPQKLK